MRRSVAVWLAALALAIVEIWLIAQVAGAIGGFPTTLLLLAIAVVGVLVARRQGRKALESLRTVERDPAKIESSLSESAVVLLGAALLIVPGFITDAVGALLIASPTRPVARKGLTATWRWATKDIRDRVTIVESKINREGVVEGEVADDPPRRRPDDPTIIRGEVEP
ncbi:FxsA family protein [Nigerium sp.]|uniref:FxsA family protein n=1 Tax=Nigerium sp. TaxID=2042655 RepID=UPI003221C517